MIRTRLTQAAAVAAIAIGTLLSLPGSASAAFAPAAVSAPATVSSTVTPGNGTWG